MTYNDVAWGIMTYDDAANLKSVGFTRTQKSRYLKNETLFLFQIKKFIN